MNNLADYLHQAAESFEQVNALIATNPDLAKALLEIYIRDLKNLARIIPSIELPKIELPELDDYVKDEVKDETNPNARLIRRVCQILQAQRGAIIRHYSDTHIHVAATARAEGVQFIEGGLWLLKDQWLRMALDLKTSSALIGQNKTIFGCPTQSYLLAPLLVGEPEAGKNFANIGALLVADKRGCETFSEDDKKLIIILARQVAALLASTEE